MALNNITTFTKPHSSGEGGGTTIYLGGNNTNITQNLNVKSINAALGNIDKLTVRDINGENAEFNYIEAAQADLINISGSDIQSITGNINDLSSQSIKTNKLKAEDTIDTNQLVANNIVAHGIVTDTLTVNKSAHFFELVIDKIRSVNGTFINTAANCKIDFVEGYDTNGNPVDMDDPNFDPDDVDYFRVYWRKDDNGKAIDNMWKQYDQAICQSFNAQEGTTYNTSNKYYWRHVLRTDNGSASYINFATNQITNNPPTDYTITFSTLPKYGGEYIDDEQQTVQEWNTNTLITGNGWDNTNQWTVDDNQQTLHVTMPDKLSFNGGLYFITSTLTKINVGIYYQDGSYEYKPAESTKTEYYIETAEDKYVVEFVLTSEIVGKWEACNWIDLSRTDCDPDSNGIPEIGDEIAQLGYRYDLGDSSDSKRASAIIMAAYQTPDTGVVPPSYAQYQGIGGNSSNRWDLSGKRKTYFDATGGHIVGEFVVDASGTEMPLDDYIQSQTTTQPVEVIVRDADTEVNICVMQTNQSNQISDLNNFPGHEDAQGNRDLFIEAFSTQSIHVYYIKCELFGRTITLYENGAVNTHPDTTGNNGIYISQVTGINSNLLRVTFSYNGPYYQTITNGSYVQFYGKISTGYNTANEEIYYPSKSISLACVTTVEGTDAEFYELNPIKETAFVDADKSLTTTLKYNTKHIVGTNVTYLGNVGGQLAKLVRFYNDGTYDQTAVRLNWDTLENCYTFTETIANYYSTAVVPIYYRIQLTDGSTVLDTRLVNVQLKGKSLFTVQENLLESIYSVATGASSQYSSLSQTVNQIGATVSSQTSSLNTITNQISTINTNISNLALTATGISASVTQVSTNLDDLENNLQRSGIDITANKITLTSENTDIQGNLNIHNADEGLIIYDNETDTPKIAIVGENLGTIEESIASPINIYGVTTMNSNTYQFGNGENDYNSLGTLNVGNKISLDTFEISIFDYAHQVSSMTYSLIIAKDGSQVGQTYSGSLTHISSPSTTANVWIASPNIDYEIPNDGQGQYKIWITITTNVAQENALCYLSAAAFVYLDSLNKIGKDAVKFMTGKNKWFWIGQDRIQMKYGDSAIDLNDTGVLYKPKNGDLGEIGSTVNVKRITSGSSYTASIHDGLITLRSGITGDPFKLYLEDPSICKGKIYYVKRVGTDVDVRVTTEFSRKFLDEDSSTTTLDYRDIGGDSYWFISDGTYWIIFYNE